MSPRTILVSGANQGIGFETVKILSNQYPDDVVLLGCRDLKKGEEAKSKIQNSYNVHVIQLDVTKQQSIDKMKELIRKQYNGRIDILVNNAGIASQNHDLESAKQTLDVNYFGLKAMCHSLEIFLTKAVVCVTSEVGCWGLEDLPSDLKTKFENPNLTEKQLDELVQEYLTNVKNGTDKHYPFPPYQDYCFSKIAANTFVRILASEYTTKHPNITVVACCPGYCATALNNFQGPRTAEAGGKSIVASIDNPQHGKFMQDGQILPWSIKSNRSI